MSCSQSILPTTRVPFSWYAVRTKSNFEKIAAASLESKGYELYLPLYRVRRRWSDRTVEITTPLFPGYLFCRFDGKRKQPILSTLGVVSVLGFGMDPAPVADSEIEAIQTVLASGLQTDLCQFLREGQRVRVIAGPLEHLEGILIKEKSRSRMVVSVTMLQRSISVEINRDWLGDI
jgi:transcription elongation factor/antiterminator RfaH